MNSDVQTATIAGVAPSVETSTHVSRRERLPDTRTSLTHKFNVSGHEGYLTVGQFEDGRPGEMFIKMAKEGSTMSGLMDTIGILTSLALQHGVPVATLARKLRHMRFEPSGTTKNPDLREAHSVVDYIFRWLGMTFSDEFRDETLSTVNEDSESAATDRTHELEGDDSLDSPPC